MAVNYIDYAGKPWYVTIIVQPKLNLIHGSNGPTHGMPFYLYKAPAALC
jgi:hypothetical protein